MLTGASRAWHACQYVRASKHAFQRTADGDMLTGASRAWRGMPTTAIPCHVQGLSGWTRGGHTGNVARDADDSGGGPAQGHGVRGHTSAALLSRDPIHPKAATTDAFLGHMLSSRGCD